MVSNWDWPQWVMISLMGLNVLAKLQLNGRLIEIKGFAGLSEFLIFWIILYFGGFWK